MSKRTRYSVSGDSVSKEVNVCALVKTAVQETIARREEDLKQCKEEVQKSEMESARLQAEISRAQAFISESKAKKLQIDDERAAHVERVESLETEIFYFRKVVVRIEDGEEPDSRADASSEVDEMASVPSPAAADVSDNEVGVSFFILYACAVLM